MFYKGHLGDGLKRFNPNPPRKKPAPKQPEPGATRTRRAVRVEAPKPDPTRPVTQRRYIYDSQKVII